MRGFGWRGLGGRASPALVIVTYRPALMSDKQSSPPSSESAPGGEHEQLVAVLPIPEVLDLLDGSGRLVEQRGRVGIKDGRDGASPHELRLSRNHTSPGSFENSRCALSVPSPSAIRLEIEPP